MNPSLPVNVFDSLYELLRVFRSSMRKAMEAEHPELTFNEMRLLMNTGRQPGITQKDLVEHSRIDKAQIARTLARMQDQGWLERIPSEDDKRVRCLYLSPEGLRCFAQLRDIQERVAARLLQDCPASMQADLLTLLHHACTSVQTHADALDR